MQRRTLLAAVGTLGIGSTAATLSAATLSETVAPTAQFQINVAADGPVVGALTPVNPGGGTAYQTVSLPRSFTDPVVIAKPLELSPQRGHTRIRNVQSDAFEIRVEEFGLQDDSNHPEVDVSYIVVEPGVTTLDGGTVLDAGTVAVAESGGLRGGFESVEFSQTLADPIAMAQTQTVNDTDAVTSHISSNKGISTNTIGGTGMEVKIENDSTNSATHAEETVGYIAIESTETLTGGEDTLGGVTFAAGDTLKHIDENAKEVDFGSSYPDGFVADLQTFIGSQEHYLRYDARTDSGVDILIEEDLGRDNNHADNVVGYLAWAL
jgi:hypothetical protein